MNIKKEIKRLREENQELRRKLEEFENHMKVCPLRNQENLPNFVKIDNKKRRKKTGQKNGHKGYSRKIPERIDVVKSLVLGKSDCCPECGKRELSNVQEIRFRYVTDIFEPQEPITTEYEIHRCYCRNCKKLVELSVLDALPNARFGLRLMLLVLLLKIGMAMPIEKILELLRNQYKLNLSSGEISCMLHQLAREFGPYYKELKQNIRDAKVRHIDETGRRIAGKNHWLWVFITKEAAFYQIRKSRGHQVPLHVLGKRCEGINISDRHSAYYVLLKKTNCSMQICWSHLLRESKKLKEDFVEGKIIHRRLKSIFKKANAFNHEGSDEDVKRLLKRIDNIGKVQFKSSMCRKFIKYLLTRDRKHLFNFITNSDIDATNNHAERGLRHDRVTQKISGGNRSRLGARTHECLLSVMQTYRLQNKNPLMNGLGYLKTKLQTAK